MDSSKTGNSEEVQESLYYIDETNQEYLNKALALAASSGFNPVVRILLEHGADINSSWASYGIGNALENGFDETARYLHEKGAQSILLTEEEKERLKPQVFAYNQKLKKESSVDKKSFLRELAENINGGLQDSIGAIRALWAAGPTDRQLAQLVLLSSGNEEVFRYVEELIGGNIPTDLFIKMSTLPESRVEDSRLNLILELVDKKELQERHFELIKTALMRNRPHFLNSISKVVDYQNSYFDLLEHIQFEESSRILTDNLPPEFFNDPNNREQLELLLTEDYVPFNDDVEDHLWSIVTSYGGTRY